MGSLTNCGIFWALTSFLAALGASVGFFLDMIPFIHIDKMATNDTNNASPHPKPIVMVAIFQDRLGMSSNVA
jgi:hypothetical protein